MKQKSRILILAIRDDAHIPYVTRHLDDEYLIVDTKRILFGDHLSYWTRGSQTEVLYRGEPIGPVKSVWYLDLSFERMGESRMLAEAIRECGETSTAVLGLSRLFHDLIGDTDSQYWAEMLPVEAMMREYARSGLNRLALALAYMYPDAFWVSRREAVVRANHKPLQLKLAQECGFRVPETITTSDAGAARAFLDRHGICVMKPLSVSAPAGHNQYTTVLRAEDPPDFSGLHVSPHIFQVLVKPQEELRVSGIGYRIFPARVFDTDPSKASDATRDWRVAFEKGTFKATPYELPVSEVKKHFRLLRRLGIVNGMSDIIVDERGDFVYLETNANGATGFIEDATGFPIGQAQARQLQQAGRINDSLQWARQYV